MSLTVSKNKVVSLSYELNANLPNEAPRFIEQTSAAQPFVFLVGSQQTIPEFENNLLTKKKGDGFNFIIEAQNAYGLTDGDLIINIPKNTFLVDGVFDENKIKVNHELAMNDADGREVIGLVKKISEEFVTMDFNHPLANHTLHFKGLIEDVREASKEEIGHGHVHGPGGHHH